MQNDLSLCTDKKNFDVKCGMYNLCPEREAARVSLQYILTDMNDIRENFIRLGFHLSEMLNNKYYEDFGFLTIEEFAAANLGMDKSNVYRYIRVFQQFACADASYDGGLKSIPCKYVLGDRWKDFSYSQLTEMCNMSPDQRMICRADMTVKQIRELKKATKGHTSAIEMRDIAQRISEGATAVELKDEFEDTTPEIVNEPEKLVAMSPQKEQKDKSKSFSYEYCVALRGAARAAYVKSRESVGDAVITFFDSEGKMVDFRFEPPVFNSMLEVLYCKNGRYVFRLKSSWESFQPEQDSEELSTGQIC